MLMRRHRKHQVGSLLGAVAVAIAAASAPAAAFGVEPGVQGAGCKRGDCEFSVTEPGTPGQGGPGNGGVVPAQPVDRDFCDINNGISVPYRCDVNYDKARDCVWQNTADQPPPPPDAPHPVGAWEECVPAAPTLGVPNEVRWMPSTVVGGQLSPSAAATEVVARMQLQGIEIGMTPKGADERGVGAVGLPAWMWVGNTGDPLAWGPYTVTEEVDGVQVTATARPKFVTWDMGDGTQVVCEGPGTPYERSFGKKESPTCGHTYMEMGNYTVAAITTWSVEWETEGESGVIETLTRSSQPVKIGEFHALNVKP